MFPRPIQTASPGAQALYRVALPLSLVIWLLPLVAIFLTSARTAQDLAAGNYWGWPHGSHLVGNYEAVFTSSPMGRYLLNSVMITLPAVAATLALSTLAGFGLAKFRFPGNTLVLAIFIAGNFVPFQILMIPVRDLMIHVFPLYNTIWALVVFHAAFQTGFCTLFMRNFMRELPDSLIEAGTHGRRRRNLGVLADRAAADPAGPGGPRGAGIHLHLERLFLGAGAGAVRQRTPDHRRAAGAAGHVAGLVAADVGRRDSRRRTLGRDLLPHAAPLHLRTNPGSGQGMNTHRLDGRDTTLLLLQRDAGLPEIVYWGTRLPPGLALDAVASLRDRATRRNGLDEDHVEAVLMPTLGTGSLRSPGLVASRGVLDWTAEFDDAAVRQAPGQLRVIATDAVANLLLEIMLDLPPDGDLLAMRSTLHNQGNAPLQVDRLAAGTFLVPATADELLVFDGRWGREFSEQRVPAHQRQLGFRESARPLARPHPGPDPRRGGFRRGSRPGAWRPSRLER